MAKFSPEKYIRQNGRKLPIERCLVYDGYEQDLFTICLIIRKHASNQLSFAVFMIDRHCLGIKNTIVNCFVSPNTVEDMIATSSKNFGPLEEVSPEYLHNLVYGALDYAQSIGFKPHKDFMLAQYLLNPELVDDGIDDIEFGIDGKPCFISGPDDNVQKILTTLNNTVGEGNYIYTCRNPLF
ncbi:MAG: hypothetical protein K9H16_04700 [Bacteroidales bacterium]|nr:hypothetical protein [Bacteroidales bacterium]